MNNKQDLPWDNPRFRNWIALVRAEKAVVRELTRSLAPLDLKIAQLDVLMNLYRHPGMSQHDLARRIPTRWTGEFEIVYYGDRDFGDDKRPARDPQ